MKTKRNNGAMVRLLLSMLIFGTIGIFRRQLPIPSAVLAMSRGWIGMLCLLPFALRKKERPHQSAGKIAFLLLSGAALGVNWILLFEAYSYTTVATATLCYYLAPTFVVLASPLLFRERLTLRRLLCAFIALLGMIPVSGLLQEGFGTDSRGLLFGVGAATLYATVVLLNKKLSGISPYVKTTVQLGTAGAVLLPYTLLTGQISETALDVNTVLWLLVVGVIHTGLAYVLYFGALDRVQVQTAALLSYIDPVFAVLLSATVLGEPLTLWTILGGILILGAAVISELPDRYPHSADI